MRHRAAFTASLVLVILATGCPFTSKTPLGEPGHHPIDVRLIGLWVGTDSDRDSLHLRVMPFNDAEYYVELTENSGAPSRYRAFILEASGQPFLHINELTAHLVPDEYSFARYTFTGDGDLSLRFVGEKIVPKAFAAKPESLSAFLGAHWNDPALDDDDSKLVLKREEPKAGALDSKSSGGGTVKP
jgi:hypothetical protein